ncbi:electron transport complex subunit RsxC [Atopomonas sediminilitoris]|uniref:electron transport complex subunit RsxC n=1 Tax=Atopomonas sediminilitoris TaxID=2919919 RepID=UPI001F4DA353|nr:electron transport complex subunit RsxC [Atopomonas sediminilitoris]MCJ8169694.1 electron transport complex subunit RsxC [Atopomonas sediminilitoris]
MSHSASAQRIWDIPGGIHPPEHKHESTGCAIAQAPLPKQLILPLAQHIGAPGMPLVRVGERVLKGQPIAAAEGFVSVPLHAPTSGTVRFIGPVPYPHVSGLLEQGIVIDCDGLDEAVECDPWPDFREREPQALLEKIRQSGISGMGGAGFPTAVKLSARRQDKLHTLVINGTECEPYITADDMLMRERANAIVSGIEILMHILQPQEVLLGIEDNKPQAIAALRMATSGTPIKVVVFPTKYPSGGEKQLIQILTGREVPVGGLPADIGIVCQNVGTCEAIARAVIEGRPLISRITTLTGAALARPQNVECLLGTPVRELLEFSGFQAEHLERLVMGGPMMGFTLPSLDVPVVKTSNCLLAASRKELPPPPPAQPCIRCGDCAQACPASLLPQQLHFFAQGKEYEQLKAQHLFDCIECGACAYVCPSSIPLVQYYRAAKAEIRELEQKHHKAEHSKVRFEQRQDRLQRETERKEAERKARLERAAALKAEQAQAADTPQADIARVQAQSASAGLSEQHKKAKIEVSMARAQLKKAEKQLAANASAELEQQVSQLREVLSQAEQSLATLDQQVASSPTAPAPAASSSDNAEALKKAKIQTAMARAQLKKAQKAAGDAPSAEQAAELAQLQQAANAAEAAQQALEATDSQSATPSASHPTASNADAEALKKAKIQTAMARAQLKKAQKAAGDAPTAEQSAEIAQLERALSSAEAAQTALEGSSPAAQPATQPATAAPDASVEALKKAKIQLAMARAQLKKAEKAQADASEIATLQAALSAAETALHQAEDNSGKPAPEHVLTDKSGVDELTRQRKTELALARAALRKAERAAEDANDDATQAALSQAQQRLQAAAEALAEHR